jgi:hypothetical protein
MFNKFKYNLEKMNAFLRKLYSKKVVPQNILSESLQGWNIVIFNIASNIYNNDS